MINPRADESEHLGAVARLALILDLDSEPWGFLGELLDERCCRLGEALRREEGVEEDVGFCESGGVSDPLGSSRKRDSSYGGSPQLGGQPW